GAVSWTSENSDVVAADVTVHPPLPGEDPVSVDLTATATVRGYSASATITVTVNPSDETANERIERLAEQIIIPPVVRSGTDLPAAPPGTSIESVQVSNDEVSADGQITSAAEDPVSTDITTTITDTRTEARATRTFTTRVLPADHGTDLLAYDRVPTSSAEANNADIALSMHLAREQEDAWQPLNDNYGIFFASTADTPPDSGTTSDIVRSLRDPHVFYLADGSFGIVATRTARGGSPDGSETSHMLFARSSDLLSYEEVGLIDLGVTSGVHEPAAVYNSAVSAYTLSWTSDAGVPMYTSVKDLTDPTTRTEIRRGEPAVTAGQGGIDRAEIEPEEIPDYAGGNALPLTAAVADALAVRFAPITNTAVEDLDPVSIAAGTSFDAGDLPGRASLTYSDGSTGTRGIIWDEDSISAVDTTTPGSYEVTGTIRQPTYPAPFADERADPSIVPFDWNGNTKFLMIATEDLNMNPVDPANGPHMPLRMADSIADLSDEALAEGRTTEHDLLRAGDTDAAGRAMTGCFWAPELHVIDGTLSILFMPCYDGSNGAPDMWTGRASIMQLKQDAQGNDLNPADPDSWT